jgi:hypothetical protein
MLHQPVVCHRRLVPVVVLSAEEEERLRLFFLALALALSLGSPPHTIEHSRPQILLKQENNPFPDPPSVCLREWRLVFVLVVVGKLDNSPWSITGGNSVRHLSNFDSNPSTLSSKLHPPTVEVSSSITGFLAIAAATSEGDGPSSDSVIITGLMFAKLDLIGVAYSIAPFIFPNGCIGVPLFEPPNPTAGLNFVTAGEFLKWGATAGEFRNCGMGEFRNCGMGEFLNCGIGEFLTGCIGGLLYSGIGEFLNWGIGEFLNSGIGEFLNCGLGVLLYSGIGEFLYSGIVGDLIKFGFGEFLYSGIGDL